METQTFAELGLSQKVLSSITDAGYTIPTPIQIQAIPVAMTGRDVLGIAQTGTGKTAAFTLPMISRLESGRARARMPRSLILAPTRELAAQVAQAFEKYGVNHKLSVALLIGGVSMDDQVAKLDRGADVLIATPGRLLDHHGRGRVMLMGVEILVIDEADRMLDMGFIPDIEKICKLLPTKRQTLFFSATMPPEITRLVDQFLNDPTRIEVARPATTAETITQRFHLCRDSEDWAKRDSLRTLIRAQDNIKNAIIFCNRKRDVAILLKSLQKHGFSAGALHGDMDQSSRTATLDKFRNNEIQLLAASDVAARGLDIPDVSHVFNFDVPWQADDYVHRIGRTGRAGREGFSATLVTFDDIRALKEIEKITGAPSQWIGEPPTEAELAEGATRKRRRGAAAASSGRADSRGARESGRDGGRERRGGRDRPERGERRERPAQQARPEVAATGVELPAVAPAGEEVSSTRERSRTRRRTANGGATRPPREAKPRDAKPRDTTPRNAKPRDATPRDAHPRDAQPRDMQPLDQVQPAHAGQGDQPEFDAAPTREKLPPRRQSTRSDERPRRDERPRVARPQNQTERQPREPRAHDQDQRPPREARTPDDRRDRRPHRRDDLGPRVGFEDNVPAFLRRPVR